MSLLDRRRLAAALLRPVVEAGRLVMEHAAKGAAVARKADSSPVTEADRGAEAILLDALSRIAPDTPVVAEESVSEGRAPAVGEIFFLVDPLDGTREFVSGQTDFTVNVGLVRGRRPVFGMVYAPALSALYLTLGEEEAVGAACDPFADPPALEALDLVALRTRAPPPQGLAAMVSRSHLDAGTERLLAELPVTGTVQAGSSLKFCRLAEGVADVYPRLGRTMEWDTAAGHALLCAAGGAVLDGAGRPLAYGKVERGFANPGFVAWGRRPA